MNELTQPSAADLAEKRMAFREVFLLHAPSGGTPLRRFGQYMYETLIESGLGRTPAPSVALRVRAVAEDLRFSAQVLSGLAAAQGTGLTTEEKALAIKAESWSREVSELVRAMEGAAGAGGGSP